MKSSAFLLLLLLTFNAGPLKADEPAKPATQEELPTVNEARGRAPAARDHACHAASGPS